MPTKKQIWIDKRDQLITRLLDAKSIFSNDNIGFMYRSAKKEEDTNLIYFCEKAIDELLNALRKSTKD